MMANRIGNVLLFIPGENITEEAFAEFGYAPGLKALCTINNKLLAFTVREEKGWFFKTKFRLWIQLPNIEGRQFGQKYFDTAAEAIEFGRTFVTNLFPKITEEDWLENKAEESE